MNQVKWNKYMGKALQPGSMTSQEPRRITEAHEVVEWTFKKIKDKSGKMLDIGCGDGYEVKLFREDGFDCYGMTYYDDEMVNLEKQDLQDYVVQGDVHDMPWETHEFNIIFSKETMEHFIAPHIALYEMNRILKPNGQFIHLIPYGWGKQKEWYHYFCLEPYHWIDVFYKTGFEVHEWGKAFEQYYYIGRKFEDINFREPAKEINLETKCKELGIW